MRIIRFIKNIEEEVVVGAWLFSFMVIALIGLIFNSFAVCAAAAILFALGVLIGIGFAVRGFYLYFKKSWEDSK